MKAGLIIPCRLAYLLSDMKKYLYIVISILLSCSVSATDLTNVARQYVLNQHPWLGQNGNDIVPVSQTQSEAAFHFYFRQTINSQPVFGAGVKINMTAGGQVLSVFDRFKEVPNVLPAPLKPLLESDQAGYLPLSNKWLAVLRRVVPNHRNEMEEVMLDQDGKVVQRAMLDLFANGDTLVQSKVFRPDPLTSSQKAYGDGGKYKNNAGADAAELTAELKNVDLTLYWENDTFYGRSPYVILQDMESPVQSVFKSKTASFSFTRSQVNFRDMMCLYHIENLREYLKSLQIPLSTMTTVYVDPSAYAGQDQSRFSYSQSNPSLYFGTGGVPDAEDADVIVHEYTHAINFFVAPNSLGGSERLALEEANCDFMACQYSRRISEFNWRQIFNWDGHNEYWPGRNGSSTSKYPADLSSDPYVSSVIWSSMLNDISEEVGTDAAVRLLFQSVASYADNISMQDAANLLMQADSLLFGNKHFDGISYRLQQRGFSVTTGAREIVQEERAFRMLNTSGFATRGESLKVETTPEFNYSGVLLDMTGKVLLNMESKQGLIELSSEGLPVGVYLLELHGEHGAHTTVKLIKSN